MATKDFYRNDWRRKGCGICGAQLIGGGYALIGLRVLRIRFWGAS